MSLVWKGVEDGIATVRLTRGKVNALSEGLVDEIRECFRATECDEAVRAVILTGHGKFFSFGFDIPELLTYPKDAFIGHLVKVTGLYAYLFSYPKPVVAALNGHAAAGGCMLALSCDYRIMAGGKARIGLTELNLGSTVTAGGIAILRYWVGGANAEKVLFSGTLFSAEEALDLKLVQEVSGEEELAGRAVDVARELARKESAAFRSVKLGLRRPVLDEMEARRQSSIHEFADIWYSEPTRRNLEQVKIFS